MLLVELEPICEGRKTGRIDRCPQGDTHEGPEAVFAAVPCVQAGKECGMIGK